jgi:hypothetical protein
VAKLEMHFGLVLERDSLEQSIRVIIEIGRWLLEFGLLRMVRHRVSTFIRHIFSREHGVLRRL